MSSFLPALCDYALVGFQTGDDALSIISRYLNP
jgi:hypothetical protein